MALRAQVSLLFTDEDLYNNLIVPYKEQRVLSELITKCLSAYYYSEETRNQIEGVSLDDIMEEGSSVESSQDICNSIRNSLAMQSFLATELQQTLETATGDMEDILQNVNKVAEDVGIVKPTKSEYGNGVPQISMENMMLNGAGIIHNETAKGNQSNVSFDLIIKVLKHILERDGDTEGMAILDGTFGSSSDVGSNTSEETSREENNTDVGLVSTNIDEVSTEKISNIESVAQDDLIKEPSSTDDDLDTKIENVSSQAIEEEVTNEPDDEDAFADMKALLESI